MLYYSDGIQNICRKLSEIFLTVDMKKVLKELQRFSNHSVLFYPDLPPLNHQPILAEKPDRLGKNDVFLL
jgi:hypothetical protein